MPWRRIPTTRGDGWDVSVWDDDEDDLPPCQQAAAPRAPNGSAGISPREWLLLVTLGCGLASFVAYSLEYPALSIVFTIGLIVTGSWTLRLSVLEARSADTGAGGRRNDE